MKIFEPQATVILSEIDLETKTISDITSNLSGVFGIGGGWLFISQPYFKESYGGRIVIGSNVTYPKTEIFQVSGDGSLRLYKRINNNWVSQKTGFIYSGNDRILDIYDEEEERPTWIGILSKHTISPTPRGF